MSCLYLCTSQIFKPYDPLSIWYGFASTPKSWIIKVPWNVHADIFNIIQRCHHTLHLSAPLPGHTKALYGTVCKVTRWSSWSSNNHRCQHGDTPPGAQTATARRRTSVRVPPRMSHHWALGQAGMVWVKFCRALRTRRTKRWVKRVKPSIPDHHYRQLVCSCCLCFLAAVFFAIWTFPTGSNGLEFSLSYPWLESNAHRIQTGMHSCEVQPDLPGDQWSAITCPSSMDVLCNDVVVACHLALSPKKVVPWTHKICRF
jgi:hypothetical protein